MPRSPSLPTHCADLPAVRGRVPPPRVPMPGRGTAEPPTRRGAARRTGTVPRRTPAAQSADRPHPCRQSVCRCLHGVQNDQRGRRRKVAPAGQQSGEQKLDCHEQSCGAVRGAQTVPVVHGYASVTVYSPQCMRPGRGQYLPGRRKTGKGACRTAGYPMQINKRTVYL